MAKYTVTHTCGHTVTVDLVGKGKDREWKLKQMEQGVCTDCYRAQQQAKAEAKAAEQGLPALEGSEKQIAWATTIRSKMIDEIFEPIRKELTKGTPKDEQAAKAIAWMIEQVTEKINTASAKWWIDNRNLLHSEYRRELAIAAKGHMGN
ncbi:hypothetical protein COLU111180_06170 [Cohnella lubricantis]|uniref:Uncharacterized protein n=1 Tax=Cohnella lubricantis TaxID=2163172 RepID=A0A841TBP1_9BACL|nr:hypothetical protein [Cohnella lubricantis]MBB6677536.1 hypothetical protein [Cohnella lubricantis]MBP2116578.1 hypothetical protein [Cohnella lubricantis]